MTKHIQCSETHFRSQQYIIYAAERTTQIRKVTEDSSQH